MGVQRERLLKLQKILGSKKEAKLLTRRKRFPVAKDGELEEILNKEKRDFTKKTLRENGFEVSEGQFVDLQNDLTPLPEQKDVIDGTEPEEELEVAMTDSQWADFYLGDIVSAIENAQSFFGQAPNREMAISKLLAFLEGEVNLDGEDTDIVDLERAITKFSASVNDMADLIAEAVDSTLLRFTEGG